MEKKFHEHLATAIEAYDWSSESKHNFLDTDICLAGRYFRKAGVSRLFDMNMPPDRIFWLLSAISNGVSKCELLPFGYTGEIPIELDRKTLSGKWFSPENQSWSKRYGTPEHRYYLEEVRDWLKKIDL